MSLIVKTEFKFEKQKKIDFRGITNYVDHKLMINIK